MPSIALIAAMTRQRVIGVNNTLPWRLSADLQRFKALTLGKPIIMGRKTWESLGRALPGRLNIVISRDADYSAAGAALVTSLEAALKRASAEATDEIMVIGGAEIYAQALPLADKLYITRIEQDIPGDAWFPEYAAGDWQAVHKERHHQAALANGQAAFDYTFIDLQRINNS